MTIDDRTLARIPRYTGRDADGEAQSEMEHFGNCPHCGALVDMRDLAQVIAHVHDRWDEITDDLEVSGEATEKGRSRYYLQSQSNCLLRPRERFVEK